ncbi:MAG: TrmH family RNA methyltransferase [Anaerorhabdus sp.]
MEINSVSNNRVKMWMKLHTKKERDKTSKFLLEGEHLIIEASKKGVIETLLVIDGYKQKFVCNEVIVCSESVLKKLSKNISGCKCIAVCRVLNSEIKKFDRLLLLDDVQDPGNMGTIIRSAVSFGFDAIIASNNSVDFYNDKTIRSTQGAIFSIPLIRSDILKEIENLKKHDTKLFAFALGEDANNLDDVKKVKRMALVFGNEGQGIRNEVIRACDAAVKIEMNNFESLNVAVAAGIAMYKFRK